MKKLLNLFVLLLATTFMASCNFFELEKTYTKDQLRELSDKAFSAWFETVSSADGSDVSSGLYWAPSHLVDTLFKVYTQAAFFSSNSSDEITDMYKKLESAYNALINERKRKE
ncbi:MAG: hypothetical protein ACRC5H_08760 [Treponemataceae bacterium]